MSLTNQPITIGTHAGPPIASDGSFMVGYGWLDTNDELYVCTGGGRPGTWVLVQATNAWTTYTPVIGGSGWSLGNGFVVGTYRLVDAKTVSLALYIATGSTTVVGSGQLTISLPPGMTAQQYFEQELAARYNEGGGGSYAAVGVITQATVVVPQSTGTSGSLASFGTGGISPPAGSSFACTGTFQIQ